MSIAGGFHRAVERACSVEATALQIFVKSARQWAAPPLSDQVAGVFRQRIAEAGMGKHTLAHAGYLINLASPDRALRQRSIRSLRDEMRRCDRLGVPYLVLHPGSHMGAGEETGLARVVRGLERVLAAAGQVSVLLEITAGQGTNLGYRFEHLAWILERLGPAERLGVCFDTCHALAAGYDLRDARSWDRAFDEFDGTIGLSRLRAFHLNDSKHGLGSRRDRHEQIGSGAVGAEAFRLIVRDRRFRGLPMVLETPKGPDLADDVKNLALLRSFEG